MTMSHIVFIRPHTLGALPYLTLPAGWAYAQRWGQWSGPNAHPRNAKRL